MPIITDTTLVSKELEKTIEIDKEIKLFYGNKITGDEKTATYSAQDKQRIQAELERIYERIKFDLAKDDITAPKTAGTKIRNFYLTAGGPGSGKTTMIRTLQEKGGAVSKAVHVDPDEILKEFRPYTEMVKALADSDVGRAIAYTYWRGASNYLSGSIMNKLAEEGIDIFMGTTGTSPNIVKTYANAKEAGYQTNVLFCHAPEDVRLSGAAERLRKERRYTPEADVKQKGNVLFPDCVPLHFAHADNIQVYWRSTMADNPVLALETRQGKVIVRNAQATDEFINEIRKYKPDLNWKTVVASYESRFNKNISAPNPKNSPI